jgi:hypothetical protein
METFLRVLFVYLVNVTLTLLCEQRLSWKPSPVKALVCPTLWVLYVLSFLRGALLGVFPRKLTKDETGPIVVPPPPLTDEQKRRIAVSPRGVVVPCLCECPTCSTAHGVR